jgi:hypothetical protein
MLPKDDTKTNLLTASAIFALFAAIVSPVVLEYSAARWYVCGALGVITFVIFMLRRRAAKAATAKTAHPLSRRDILWRRLISGIGAIVIGGVVAALIRTPNVDTNMFHFLVGFLVIFLGMFASTFARASRQSHEEKRA